jgi:predicted RNase H-like HicB family nuclease
LPGCISEGDTVPEALENAKDAIEGYISVMVKHGRQIPIERERQVRVFSKVKTAKQKKYA